MVQLPTSISPLVFYYFHLLCNAEYFFVHFFFPNYTYMGFPRWCSCRHRFRLLFSTAPTCCATLKARLQHKGTKSVKRHLKKRSHRMSRFSKDVNHCLSKHIVAKAKDTLRMIAMEDLQDISSRCTVRKAQEKPPFRGYLPFSWTEGKGHSGEKLHLSPLPVNLRINQMVELNHQPISL